MMTTEIEQAVQKALQEKETQEKVAAEIAAGEVGGGTYVWAIVAALLSPIVGVGIGVYQLVKGRTSKGWTYIGFAIAGFVLSFLILAVQ